MAYQDAATYSEQRGGRSFLVAVNGEVAYEDYPNGGSKNAAPHIHSATKCFWGPVAHAMVEDGHWGSLDDSVADYIPNWRGYPKFEAITLQHLLWMTSGLVADNNHVGGQCTNCAADYYEHVRNFSTKRHNPVVIRQPANTRFQYKPSDFYAFGEAIRQTVGDPLEYLNSRFFVPLGIEYGHWDRRAGNPHIPNGCHISARNWLTWMEFLRSDGVGLLSKAAMDHIKTGSMLNPGEGDALWLNAPDGFDNQGHSPIITPLGQEDAFCGAGWGMNVSIVFPQLNMTLVRQAESGNLFSIHDFVAELMK